MSEEEKLVGTTPNQSIASSALEALGYNMIPNPGGKCGGPQKYTITEAALDALKGKTVTIDGDATVTID